VVRAPRGEVVVLVLADGTAVHVPPHVLGTAAPKLGARAHVEGALVGDHLRATALEIAGTPFSLAPPATPPPPPDRAPALGDVEDTGKIANTLAAPDGSPDILLLADGTSVMLGPPLRAAASQLHAGVTVHVKGEGGRYDGTMAMHARTLEIDGTTFTDDGPPPPPSPATR